jgi:hypothetical protein
MKREHIDPKVLHEHGKLPETTVQMGVYHASNGLEIPVELRFNEHSLIKVLWEEEMERRKRNALQEKEILLEKRANVKEIPPCPGSKKLP